MPSPARLALAVAVAARLAAAQFDAGQALIDDCRARLPANTVFNVINSSFGVTGPQNLNPTAPGLFATTVGAACAGYSLNTLPKHVSGGSGTVAVTLPLPRVARGCAQAIHTDSPPPPPPPLSGLGHKPGRRRPVGRPLPGAHVLAIHNVRHGHVGGAGLPRGRTDVPLPAG